MLNGKRRLGIATLACVGFAFAISSMPAAAWERGDVETFALIPSSFPMVEGLTVGPDGKVYTATFNPNGSGPAQLFTFDPQGNLLASKPIMVASSTGPRPSSPAILGLEVIPKTTNKLLVLDFGKGEVLAVDPTTGNASECIVLPTANPGPPNNGLNGITFDKFGNVYFSDSFAGVIWTFSPNGGSICGAGPATASVWASDPSKPGTQGGTLLPNKVTHPRVSHRLVPMESNSTMRALRCLPVTRQWIGLSRFRSSLTDQQASRLS